MKKTKKLEIKKVTLRSLDELALDAVAGGETGGANGNTCVCLSKFGTCVGENTGVNYG